MPNQELTTLLSTVLGGVLAIIGGFSASYFMQVIRRREEKSRGQNRYQNCRLTIG